MPSRRTQIQLQPDVLLWARERARLEHDDLARKMQVHVDRVVEWEESGVISIAQVDKLAVSTHTPLGYLYLSSPFEEPLPIPDLRTRDNDEALEPSVDLLESVYSMQQRQAWMREELIEGGHEPLQFVGAYSVGDNYLEVADAMRRVLGFESSWANIAPRWIDALGFLRDRLTEIGVLVIFNGIVGNSTRRKLDPDEFQGFALVDEYAPLIFVNNSDFVAAKTFTLAHEMVHLFVGESGISQFDRLQPSRHEAERFCNTTAAEFLVPELEIRTMWRSIAQSDGAFQTIARQFKVSEIVAARRVLDLGLIDHKTFFDFYDYYKQRVVRAQAQREGGDFWNTQTWRLNPRFAAAVVRAVNEGRLPYREAYSLTGLRDETFDNLSGKMEVQV